LVCQCTRLHTRYLKQGEDFLGLIFMMISPNTSPTQMAIGKYLVSPLAKPQGEGRYIASVSIRSGKGSATHDRVMRFSTLFDSAASALHYATEHALGWIKERSTPACA
jgi:hypothetical protein